MKDLAHFPNITPDDPRLTAYALGELEGGDLAEISAAVARDPALQAIVDDIRRTGSLLAAALEAEAEADTEAAPASVPIAAASTHPIETKNATAATAPHTTRRWWWLQPPVWVATGLVAACVAVVVLLESRLADMTGAKKAQTVAEAPKPENLAAVKELREFLEEAESQETQVENPAVAISVVPPSAPARFAEFSQPSLAQNEPTVRFQMPDDGLAKAQQRFEEIAKQIPVAGSQTESIASLSLQPAFPASTPPTVAAARKAPAESETIQLSAFTVSTEKDQGYLAANSISGTRFGTSRPNPRAASGSIVGGVIVPTRLEHTWHYAPSPEPPLDPAPGAPRDKFNTEAYDRIVDNRFLDVAGNPLSTFSVDVDTASYSNLRRFLIAEGRRPPPDAVRIEEMLNSFTYDYAPPAANEDAPFAAHIDAAAAPWAPEHRLVRIGLKGREVSTADRPAANLVFLLDVSGSMRAPNKLPLVQESMRLLVAELKPTDRVAIVVYAGASGLALPSTPVRDRSAITAAIDELRAGGSTNGAMGIQLAYDIAKANFVTGGINRVILATDGDFNVGVTDRGQLLRLIEEKAKTGVFLTVLGFGMGNIKDATLEQIADKGNGAYAYIDNEREARRVMVEQGTGTLMTIAKDVKVQVEFNPAHVQAYRLIGYENRVLAKEDFNNDKVDAGDIGAGHTVTALYEIVPAGVAWQPESNVDALKYQPPAEPNPKSRIQNPKSPELLTVKLRYKAPDGDTSRLLEFPFTDRGAQFGAASEDFMFASAVAAFGMVLRESPHKGTATLTDVLAWAAQGQGADRDGRRGEFIDLVRAAQKVGM